MGLLDRIAPRKSEPDVVPTVSVAAGDPVFATKALRKFLSCLTSRESPVLLDLGPVVGSNVSFFGEQLNCKIFVEDLFADVDRHVRDGTLDALPEFLQKRFPQETGSVATTDAAGATSGSLLRGAMRSRRPIGKDKS